MIPLLKVVDEYLKSCATLNVGDIGIKIEKRKWTGQSKGNRGTPAREVLSFPQRKETSQTQ
jgi:hypothetical protein